MARHEELQDDFRTWLMARSATVFGVTKPDSTPLAIFLSERAGANIILAPTRGIIPGRGFWDLPTWMCFFESTLLGHYAHADRITGDQALKVLDAVERGGMEPIALQDGTFFYPALPIA